MLQIDQKLLDEIFKECVARHPEEACGLVLGVVEADRKAKKIVSCKNQQNELHAKDPKRYPRDAKTAYVIDPKELQSIEDQAKTEGLDIIAMFHSHPEHDVYFSEEDKGMAAPWGEPLFPNRSYVVVSIYDKKIKGASDFDWDEEKKDFVERKITLTT